MEVREDDEEFKNPVDLMFDALEAEKPNHFAVRQYKKYNHKKQRKNQEYHHSLCKIRQPCIKILLIRVVIAR